MSDEPYLGSLLLTPYSFAPRYFAFCNGQLFPIAQNQALFSLLGTMYGGNGTTNFALPDLRGRVALGQGPSATPGHGLTTYVTGQAGGVENVTLQTSQLPVHTHDLLGSGRQATTGSPAGALPASGGQRRFARGGGAVMATPDASGASQPHPNTGPSLTLSWVIAIQGVYPSRN